MQNYYLPADANEDFFPKRDADKIKNNIEIIKLVKELDQEGKQATTDQQAKLATYVGWGGLANEFFDEFNPKYQNDREELKSLVSHDEYQNMKASSLTAYYTNPAIARAMWQKVTDSENDDSEFTHGNVLDPSMGTGIFFMTMPEQLRGKVNLYGIELDSITGMIAKQLFPEAKIFVKGFEDVKFKGAHFDLVITNVPFGDTRLLDDSGNNSYYIHDYFLKKAVDVTRDYGLIAIITSTGLMDKRTNNILEKIENKVAFLGGVRMPTDVFKQIAGTQVTTDMLFFQKNMRGDLDTLGDAFMPASQYPLDRRVWLNTYFISQPQQVLGSIQIQNYHGATLTVVDKGDFLNELPAAIGHILPAQYLYSVDSGRVEIEEGKLADTTLPDKIKKLPLFEYGYANGIIYFNGIDGIVKDGKPEQFTYYTDGSTNEYVGTSESASRESDYRKQTDNGKKRIYDNYVSAKPNKRGKYAGCIKHVVFYYTNYSAKETSILKSYIDLRDTYQKLINLQLSPKYGKNRVEYDTQFKFLLQRMNDIYDHFAANFGSINLSKNTKLFREDKKAALVESLEDHILDPKTGKQVYIKSKAFKQATVRPNRVIKKVDSAIDALLSSVSEARGMDFTYMKTIYPGHSKQEIIDQLADHIIIDPQKYNETGKTEYITKEDFLSGDVVTKRDVLKELIESNDFAANWQHYLELIEKVLPKRLTIADISFHIGSPWIPDKIISNFLLDSFFDPNKTFNDSITGSKDQDLIVHTPKGRVIAEQPFAELVYSVECSTKANEFKIERDGQALNGYDNPITIFNYLLQSKQPTITMITGYDKNDKPIREVDETSTAMLRDLEKKLEAKFTDYITNNATWSKELEDTYNNKNNRIVNKKYDGSRLHINGLAKGYHLRPYQRNAVQRIIEDKRALLAHEVGTGKTLTMISAGFKLKDLGLVNKPMFVVPTNLVSQFSQDILKFYPTKNVLITTAEDFSSKNRKRFLARIISGEYDAVVIGHSQFEKIPASVEAQHNFIQDRLDSLENSIASLKDRGESISVKQLERNKKALSNKIKRLSIRNQDNFLTFEELGVDFLFVDEAHNYKNIAPATSLGRIKGINSQTSKRAMDMLMKIRLLQNKYDFGHVVFATGTPVSNTISELWTMMNYIQPDILKKFDIANFDDWAGSFGKIRSELELNTTGNKYRPVKRFERFVNLPELMNIYHITADVQMADGAHLSVPKATKYVIKSELTNAQQSKLQELIDRTDAIQDHEVTPDQDNMLKITNEARKLTLDMRLFSNKYSADDSTKLNQVADNVYRIWKRTTKVKGTQIIFSDLGTPKAGQFDVYNELKKLLVAKGIPVSEIAFMHQASNDEARIQLERKVNAGDIRVLIGSTQKGGTGLNVQTRMKAAHHLDVPWRPSDIIQRNGRLVRQGNMFCHVEIYHYITTGSFDNYLWQIQENKLKYITQIMTNNSPIRAMHDVDSQTMTASDFKAIATQNPYLKLKMKVDNDLTLLVNQKYAFDRNYREDVRTYERSKVEAPVLAKDIDRLKEDIATTKPFKHSLLAPDIVFNNGQVFKSSREANKKLFFAIRAAAYAGAGHTGNKPIAKIANLSIEAGYNMTSKITTGTYGLHTCATIFLVGKGSYPLRVDLTDFLHLNYALRIRNYVVNLPGLLKSWEHNYNKKRNIIKQGVGSSTFAKLTNIQYLSEKKKILDPLIAGDAKVEKITAQITKFENEWATSHPDFAEKANKAKEKVEAIKYNNDLNDYDDSLFEDFESKAEEKADTKSVAKTEIPTSTKSALKKPVAKTNKSDSNKVTVTLTKSTEHYEEINLFSFDYSKDKKISTEDKKQSSVSAKPKQLSLF